jgi:hypothetical protein
MKGVVNGKTYDAIVPFDWKIVTSRSGSSVIGLIHGNVAVARN